MVGQRDPRGCKHKTRRDEPHHSRKCKADDTENEVLRPFNELRFQRPPRVHGLRYVHRINELEVELDGL